MSTLATTDFLAFIVALFGFGHDPSMPRSEPHPDNLAELHALAMTCSLTIENVDNGSRISATVLAGQEPVAGSLLIEVAATGLNNLHLRQERDIKLAPGESAEFPQVFSTSGFGTPAVELSLDGQTLDCAD